MLALLDKRFQSKQTATRISILTAMYSKRFNPNQDMRKYIDEFETLFAQLERIGSDIKIPEAHKAPLLLAIMGNSSPLESPVAALRTKDTDQLSWEAVSSDVIQEWTQLKPKGSGSPEQESDRNDNGNGNNCRRRRLRANRAASAKRNFKFCDGRGHTAENCYSNPESPNCKLLDKVKSSLQSMIATASERQKQHKISQASFWWSHSNQRKQIIL